METSEIKIKNTRVKIFSFLEKAGLLRNDGEFIESVMREIKENNRDGFAGFLDKEGLRSHLESWVCEGPLIGGGYPQDKISTKECSYLIQNVFENISEILDKREISFYLFPTLSGFTINKMGGSGGVLIWKNIIYIEIFPIKGWEKHFKSSLVHELAHALSPYFNVNSMNIGQGFIFDGIAEHLQEKFVGIKSPWTKAITENQVLEILRELKNNDRLNHKNFNLYNELFYGTGKYPLWTGYTIGYYLVGEYLKKQKNIDWKKLLRINPEIILNSVLKNLLN